MKLLLRDYLKVMRIINVGGDFRAESFYPSLKSLFEDLSRIQEINIKNRGSGSTQKDRNRVIQFPHRK